MRQREKLSSFMSLPHALKRFFPLKTMVRFKVTVNEPATFALGWPQQSFRNNKLPGAYSSVRIISETILIMTGGSGERTRVYIAAGRRRAWDDAPSACPPRVPLAARYSCNLPGAVLNLHERKPLMSLQVPLEIEQLARLVAIKTGKTPSDIIKEAVEARAEAAGIPATSRRRSPEEIEQRLKEIAERVAALPVLDDRGPDEIIGYNETGVPE
jgi:antitoxin VapB